ncbi:M20/M25/M40 family metallo-hydrolase [Maledivibacter halophilus]|uniref:Arginine utilization protein RocB n=1 Tax=Maledivibacter halophilus TaxID=36842 RepID=A0A1T5MNU7_9FIRM|nr:M20/M25/M40 family metallo-hydrolase [Maledivibacter halophilus]SKC89895.1 Arginine utilization protein RocB [Maledivibacter halophilus]
MLNQKEQELIESIFYRLVAVRSDSNSFYEPIIEDIILNWFKQCDYFSKNLNYVGTHPLDEDRFQREVVWALVKGEGDETIVLINHHDAVDIEEYGKIKDLAFRPDELKEELKKKIKQKSILKDLNDDKWIFGRGTADMKAGVALQMGIMDKVSRMESFKGNLLFLSVPDEETISKGMLAAVTLMNDLKSKFGLNYILAVNSEPYFNHVKDKAIMYEGSVGKVMPIIYVKGVKSHIADPYGGVNPSLILARIQQKTEINPEMSDVYENDATPPPVWVNLKDRKKTYDASIPEAAVGYFNWLTFTKSPIEIIDKLKVLCSEAMDETLKHIESCYKVYCEMNHDEVEPFDYEPEILTFSHAYELACKKYGEEFINGYEEYLDETKDDYLDGKITLPEVAVRLIEYTGEQLRSGDPLIIIGISGPFYPHINNKLIEKGERYDLEKKVNEICSKYYNVKYQSNQYFMGLCDLSYCGFIGDLRDIETIKENSPGWDDVYKIPFDELDKLTMPVVNIGPWGKDLHEIAERVYKPDVFERVPTIIFDLIQEILS